MENNENKEIPPTNQKRKHRTIYIGVCVAAILALGGGIALSMGDSSQEAVSETVKVKSYTNENKQSPNKNKIENDNKSVKKIKSDSAKDVLDSFGISPKTLPRSSGYSALLTSEELREVTTAYKNQQKNTPTEKPITLPAEKPMEPKEKPVIPPVEPPIVLPILTAPTIFLTTQSIVIGQHSFFDPYYYFSINDGGDSSTTVSVSSIDTSILGQQYLQVTASNHFGTTHKSLAVYVNGLPTINLKQQAIDVPVRSTVDLLSYVEGFDPEYGDITNQIVVTSDLDVTKLGDYTVTYDYVDSFGFSAASKTATIHVTNEAPVIHAKDTTIEIDQPFDPLTIATGTDREDGSISLITENVLKNDVKIDTEGTYEVTYGQVKDQDSTFAEEVTIKVTVVNEAPKVEAPEYVLFVGDSFDSNKLKETIRVTDREDDKSGKIPTFTLDEAALSEVTTNAVGTFIIPGVATDSHGKTTPFNVTIKIQEKEPVLPEPESTPVVEKIVSEVIPTARPFLEKINPPKELKVQLENINDVDVNRHEDNNKEITEALTNRVDIEKNLLLVD